MTAVEFCNAKVFPQIKMPAIFNTNLREVLHLVENFYGGKTVPADAEAFVDDGFLFLDGEKIGRIAPKLPRPFTGGSDALDYLEGRCLGSDA